MSSYSGPGLVLYQGVPLLQALSVNFQVMTDNKDVNTLALGHAGHSKGPKKVQVQVENAIPSSGLEVNWVAVANAQVEVALSFKVANKTWNCVGDVREADIKTGTENANGVSFTFHGRIVTEL